MGNTETKERQLFIRVILKLLSKRGIKVKKTNIQSFFTFVQEQCPWFPQEGTVNLDIWGKVGKQLSASCAQRGPEKIPTNTFSLGNMIRPENTLRGALCYISFTVKCVPSAKLIF